ncbi:hypothetical protein ACOMHN_022244 [Nucella lapillus]
MGLGDWRESAMKGRRGGWSSDTGVIGCGEGGGRLLKGRSTEISVIRWGCEDQQQQKRLNKEEPLDPSDPHTSIKLKSTPRAPSSLPAPLPSKEEARDSAMDIPDPSPESLSTRCAGMTLQHRSPELAGSLDKRSLGSVGIQTTHSHAVSLPGPSSAQCQFGGSSYSPSCALSGVGAGEGQVYYPHHPGVSRVSSGFLPVSSASGMGGGPLLNSSMASLHASHSAAVASCRIPSQSECPSLHQPHPHSSLSAPGAYGGLRSAVGPSQASAAHPSLASCTYMQSSQPYAHLNSSMHMMNFPPPMH